MLHLYPAFIQHCRSTFPYLAVIDELTAVADFSKLPLLPCFEQARRFFPRKIIYYTGPANSGKTYAALKLFQQATRAVYCCPLRLLAAEIYDKMRAGEGRENFCNLITGPEREIHPGAKHLSCTIEMVDLERSYDVAVVDEIQMIGHVERGWAWTRAVVGLAADVIYLCGDPSAIPLVNKVLAMSGEQITMVHTCHAKNELLLEAIALGSYAHGRVKEGDCIICFSKKDLFHVGSELKV